MSRLPVEMLRDLHAAVISAGLARSRDQLFAFIDPAFRDRLPPAGDAGAQIMSDLDVLNRTQPLADGTDPLAIWLDNAVQLAGKRVEAARFAAARERLRALGAEGAGVASAPAWIASIERRRAALDEHFAGHARVLGVLHRPPALDDMGELSISDDIKAAAARIGRTLSINDRHALVDGAPAWGANPLSIRFRTADFSVVQALRRSGARPPVLSANAVIVAAEERTVLLHKRAAASATYGERFHTIGGAHVPLEAGRKTTLAARPKGDRSLVATLIREISEESDQHVGGGRWPAVMVEETTTGFVQYVALGVPLDAAAEVLTAEGKTRPVSFDALPAELLDASCWVPSGKLHVLLWLAAGTPSCPGARFAGLTAGEVLESVLARSSTDYGPPAIKA